MVDRNITHEQIYDELCIVKDKVDKLQNDTAAVVTAFEAARGAFLVLDWIAKIAKPIIIVVGFIAGVATVWHNHKG